MKAKLSIEGYNEFDNALASLPKATQKRVLVKALKAGGEIIADEARRLVPTDTFNLRESIIVSPRLNDRQSRQVERENWAEVYVGPRSGGGAPDGFYGHMVEFGTRSGERGDRISSGRTSPADVIFAEYSSNEKVAATQKRKKKPHVRKVRRTHPGTQPQPYLRPAFDSKTDAAMTAIAAVLRAEIFKSIDRRAARKG